jgi:F-type H+-transporting ATPase subunit epsilon
MLNLLAESAEHINQIDAERAKNAKERARERLKDSAIDDTVDKERAQKAKDRADNRIKLSIDVTVDTNTG